MIRLVVKGKRSQALVAAVNHNIHFASVFLEHERFDETWLTVPQHAFRRVVDWYCETRGGAPFPDGTLLFYHNVSE